MTSSGLGEARRFPMIDPCVAGSRNSVSETVKHFSE